MEAARWADDGIRVRVAIRGAHKLAGRARYSECPGSAKHAPEHLPAVESRAEKAGHIIEAIIVQVLPSLVSTNAAHALSPAE